MVNEELDKPSVYQEDQSQQLFAAFPDLSARTLHCQFALEEAQRPFDLPPTGVDLSDMDGLFCSVDR